MVLLSHPKLARALYFLFTLGCNSGRTQIGAQPQVRQRSERARDRSAMYWYSHWYSTRYGFTHRACAVPRVTRRKSARGYGATHGLRLKPKSRLQLYYVRYYALFV